MRPVCFLPALVLFAMAAVGLRAADPDAAPLDLFEKRIRPVLIAHCYECHSEAKKVKGGLRVDTREALAKGGDSGAVILAGKPDESLLIEALRSEGALKMPPKGKLPQTVIDDFERWVKLGAPDPRHGDPGRPARSGELDVEAGRKHWAYQPPVDRGAPDVRDASWPATPIDKFVLAKIETADAQGRPARRNAGPAGAARPEVLVRRLYFDLIGLPPSPEQIDEFLADRSPDAWEKLVDRLLASPRFGERWGRHWLDVVRFAESITLRGFVLKEAWRYRDYVIESFDQDLPFDRFLVEQIAGDLLPETGWMSPRESGWLGSERSAAPSDAPGGDLRSAPATPVTRTLQSDREPLRQRQRHLIATAFLMLGNTNLEEQDKPQLDMDLIDEQLDVIGRGLLAQTITCARCHDHKFDPIPTRDYYALAGILKGAKTLEHENVSKWVEVPLPLEPEEEAIHKRHEEKLTLVQERLRQNREAVKRATSALAAAANPAVVAVSDLAGVVVDDSAAKAVGEWRHSKAVARYIGEGYLHDLDAGKGDKTLTFDPELPSTGKYEVRLAYTPATNRADNVPVIVFSADGEKSVTVNERETPPIDGRFVSLGEYRFEQGGQSFVIVSTGGTNGHVVADAVQFLPAGADSGATARAGPQQDAVPESDEIRQLREEGKRLEGELKSLKVSGPRRPMAMAPIEQSPSADLAIHIRGTVHNLGPVVPRGFLQVACNTPPPAIPPNAGGRLQLAEWIASRDNPLTARVIVNRVWHWLFGAGLVRTTDNFGTTGESPSHPELLDHLAVTFMEDGWSIKRLIRRIVLSRTYRLSTDDDAQALAADPENRLLARMNRRRLDAECLRDAMLQISGGLRDERGGITFPTDLAADYGFVHRSDRRSVYLPVFRNSLPDFFEAFDFADPSTVVGRRNSSTVALQALFLMNDPFVIEQSRLTARRLLAETESDDSGRLARAYRLLLGRRPTREEAEIADRYLATSSGDPESRTAAWSRLVQALFATLQFRYID